MTDMIASGDYVSFRMTGYRPTRYGCTRVFGHVVGPAKDGRGYLVDVKGNPKSKHATECRDRRVRVELNNITKECG